MWDFIIFISALMNGCFYKVNLVKIRFFMESYVIINPDSEVDLQVFYHQKYKKNMTV